jgi:hypothetical protein
LFFPSSASPCWEWEFLEANSRLGQVGDSGYPGNFTALFSHIACYTSQRILRCSIAVKKEKKSSRLGVFPNPDSPTFRGFLRVAHFFQIPKQEVPHFSHLL